MLRSWNRPTINWSLQCESEGISRQDAYASADLTLINTQNGGQFHKIGVWIVVLVSLEASVIFCCIIFEFSEDGEMEISLYVCVYSFPVRLLVFLILFTIIIVPIYQIDDELVANVASVDRFALFPF